MANSAQRPVYNLDSQMQIDSTSYPKMKLPSGHCNFRNLNNGSGQVTCGCRQFWLDTKLFARERQHENTHRNDHELTWCFCGHHACFHELKNSSSSPLSGQDQNSPCQDSRWMANLDTDYRNPSAPPDFPSHTGFTNASSFAKPEAVNPANLRRNPSFHSSPAFRGECQPPNQYQHRQDPCEEDFTAAQRLPKHHHSDSHFQDIMAAGLHVYIGDDDDLTSTGPAARLTRQNFGIMAAEKSSPRHNANRSLMSTGMAQTKSQSGASPIFTRPLTDIRKLDTSLPNQINDKAEGDDAAQSVTEVATPSMMGTPALRVVDETVESIKKGIDDLNQKFTTPEFAPRSPLKLEIQDQSIIEQLLQKLTALKAILASNPDLATSISNINNRIDALECASFDHSSVEEIQERLELFDGRLIELEEKVEELQKNQALADQGHQHQSFITSVPERADMSFISDESSRLRVCGSENLGEIPVFGRIDHAESKLRLLRNTVPTSQHIWSIKIVLIPWGRELKGLWCSPDNSTQLDSILPLQGSQVWTSTGDKRPTERITTSSAEGYSIGWHTESNPRQSPTPERLLPRACAENSTVYKRLESRGFVREVSCSGESPESIRSSIQGAFQHLQSLFLGPNLLPLRKIHKASRLAFLTPSEIDSAQLWTSQFLVSELAMKAAGGKCTLFMTNASGYLQRPGSTGDTWQRLRELPRLSKANVDSQSHVDEADAAEAYWAWHCRLDPPISVHSSASELLKQSAHSSFISHPLSPQQTDRSPSPRSADEIHISDSEMSTDSMYIGPPRLAPTTPLSDEALLSPATRHNQASQFRRTISLPLTSGSQPLNQQLPKRSIASSENQACPSTAIQIPLNSDQKRRRLSRTPEANIMAWGLTPRRSREPPSPGEQDELQHGSDNEQGRPIQNTGVAYATPFSNNPTATEQQPRQVSTSEFAEQKRSGLSTIKKSSLRPELNLKEDEEEAWEGMEDEESLSSHPGESVHVGFSNDMDLDDGIASSSAGDEDEGYENESEADESMSASDDECKCGAQAEEDMDEE